MRLSEHPWSDLSEEELKEMVAFCRDFFKTDLYEEEPWGVNSEHTVTLGQDKTYWDWKKGDWAFTEEDGVVLVVGLEHGYVKYSRLGKIVDERTDYGWEKMDPVPLPLAHQWMLMEEWREDMNLVPPWKGELEKFPWFYVKSDRHKVFSQHENPHYSCYLAFRGIVEMETECKNE